MISKVKFQDNEFYIPINSFIKFCDYWNLQRISVSLEQMKAIINTPYNIFDYTINESDTDYIVTIFSDFDFNKNIPKFTISSSNQLEIVLPNSIAHIEDFKTPLTNNHLSIFQNTNESIILFQSKLPFTEYSYTVISEGIKIRILKI